MKERNLQLDALKVIACFAVVVIHVTGIISFNLRNKYSINHTLYYITGYAVPIFFMVNGYFQLNRKNIGYTYVAKKICNILLVVLAWNVLLRLIINIFSTNSAVIVKKGDVISTLISYISKIKISSNPIITSLNSLIQRDYFWQFWFFGSLVIIYAVLPILHKFFANNKAAITITILIIVCCLAVDSVSIYRSINGKPIVQAQVPQTFRLWTWFAYYLLGGLLGKRNIMDYFLSKVTPKLNVLIFLVTSIVISVYQYSMAHKYYHLASIEFFYDNIFTFTWIISLFLLIFRCKVKPFMERPLGLISDKIMGIYIVHVTVLNLSTSFYKFDTPITNIALIFIVAGISLIVTLIISKIPVVNRLIRI